MWYSRCRKSFQKQLCSALSKSQINFLQRSVPNLFEIERNSKQKNYKYQNFCVRFINTSQNNNQEDIKDDNFDLKKYLLKQRIIIDEALDKSLVMNKQQILVEAMRYQLLNGGKRMCPIVCIAACELVGGCAEDALGVACAHEMIHAMSLAHDDLPAMDNDEFRRGQPSCWKKYGEDIAILAGDALIAYAFEYIARCSKKLDAQIVLQVIVELGQCMGVEGVAGGQAMDIQMSGSSNVDLQTLEYIHTHKTAKLLESAAVCGVLVANGTKQDVQRMRSYALNVGLAYQIIDDIVDITQTSQQLGKSAGKDIYQGKITYPKLIGLEQSREVAEDLIQNAKQQLLVYCKNEKVIPLIHLADYILNRTS